MKTNKIFNMLKFLRNIKYLLPLLKDYTTGKYRKTPLSSILSIMALIVYVLSPLDFIMDRLPFLGQLDDTLAIILVLFALNVDLTKYKKWKKSRQDKEKETKELEDKRDNS